MSISSATTKRTTFYDELIRRRRAAWVAASVCALVSAGIGLVLSTIITPIVLVMLGGLFKLLALLGVADSLALGIVKLIQDFVASHLTNFDRFAEALERVNGLGDMLILAQPLTRLLPTALPALAAGIVVWLWLRRLFGHSSGHDLGVRLGARPAKGSDFEERQLCNIVEEVAIGAGAPTPSLLLIDTPIVNAAALGYHDNGIVLFTRGMVDQLNRSETEAIAARLISAIGAGDLRAAAGIMAVLRTLGFFLTLLDLPIRGSAWRTLGGLLFVSVTRRTSAETVGRIGEELEDSLQGEAIPDLEKIASDLPQVLAKLVRILLLPFYLLSAFYKLILFLWTAFFLGPPMALLWRNRCYWTDARTVKIVRNPEAFATALEKIGSADLPPGGEAFAYLFISGPTASRRIAERRSLPLALTPSTSKRLARLSAMGATPRDGRNAALAALLAHPLRAAVVAVLSLLLVPLFSALVVAIGFLTAIVMTFGLVVGLSIVQAVI